ncbi:MAG: hypothetical protein EOO46_01395 [Flavobacterium sp.]|nr:MAG: hypothetical protein EOO46_01395 [Flavobacterium sp.]
MPTRIEVNNNLANILTPIVEIPQHLQANQVILDYVDQEVSSAFSGDTWISDKPNYYNKTQVDTIAASKADLVGGKVPASQLPSYVDDVIEVANYAALPVTGEGGKLYVTIATNKLYRWSGSIYVDITGGADTLVTGGTYTAGVATFRNNTGGTFTVTGFNTGNTEVFVTGGTYTAGTATFRNNTGGTFTVSGFATGSTTPTLQQVTDAGNSTDQPVIFEGTVEIQSSLMQGLDVSVWTGATAAHAQGFGSIAQGNYAHAEGEYTLANGIGSHAEGLSTTANGEHSHAQGANTEANDDYTFASGMSSKAKHYASQVLGLGVESTVQFQTVVGQYNKTSSFNPASLFVIGNGIDDETRSDVADFTKTGITFNAAVSATTYYGNGSNLTGISGGADRYITGGTYSNGTATFTNNTGGTFNVTGFKTNDLVVTGGTYSNGTATFTNNTGGTFNVTGFKTTDLVVTGGTHSAGTTTFRNNTGGTFTVTGYQNGNSTITLAGAVTGTGTSSITTVIVPNAVTNAMLAGSIDDSKISSSATWNGKADKLATVKAVTGTTYTLLSGDNGTVLNFTNASGCTLTAPSGLTNGFNCLLVQSGIFPVEISAGTGATVNKKSSLYRTTNGENAIATLLQLASNTFLLSGDLEQIP